MYRQLRKDGQPKKLPATLTQQQTKGQRGHDDDVKANNNNPPKAKDGVRVDGGN